MHALVTLTCSDEGRRSEIADALVRTGIELAGSFDDDLATLHIVDDAEGLQIRDHEDTLIRLTGSLPAKDIVALVRIALDIAALRDVVHSFEDAESAGVIAANIGQEAREALIPVLFSATALARRNAAASELTNLLIVGLNRVMRILQRITPAERAGAGSLTCANEVITNLAGAMRAMAQPAKLITRLESPIPMVVIDRADLERMLLNLVANATDAGRILVATSRRNMAADETGTAPAGSWIVVEIENDGVLTAEGLGLPSIARVTRSAGGHISVDSGESGTRIEIWLPCTPAE